MPKATREALTRASSAGLYPIFRDYVTGQGAESFAFRGDLDVPPVALSCSTARLVLRGFRKGKLGVTSLHYTVMINLVVEGLTADAQDSGGFGLIPVHRFQHFCQVLAFQV